MKGAVLETDGPIDRPLLDACLDHAGVRVVNITVEKGSLPVL
jgi:hypothetical protein